MLLLTVVWRHETTQTKIQQGLVNKRNGWSDSGWHLNTQILVCLAVCNWVARSRALQTRLASGWGGWVPQPSEHWVPRRAESWPWQNVEVGLTAI